MSKFSSHCMMRGIVCSRVWRATSFAQSRQQQADWGHHPTASLELVDQRGRDQVGRRRDYHLVERRVLGPAGIAVPDTDFDVGVALLFQALHCSLGEFIDDLD